MKYKLLGKSGLRVSELCLGTMTFGTDWSFGVSQEESQKVFDYFLEQGGNFIDTANLYTNGTSEKFLGEFIQSNRDFVVLATKYTLSLNPNNPNGGGNHKKCLVHSVNNSLRRLNTDYIDLLWLHSWDFITPHTEIMQALNDIVKSGKVLYIGISNAPAWEISRANTYADLKNLEKFIGLQIQYNLLERGAERELLPMAQSLGLGIVPWSPLAGGILTGKYNTPCKPENSRITPESTFARYLTEHNFNITEEVIKIAETMGARPSQIALKWLISTPYHPIPIIGAKTVAQLEENMYALEISLNEEQLNHLNRISQIDLGYPHDFLQADRVKIFIFGNNPIQP